MTGMINGLLPAYWVTAAGVEAQKTSLLEQGYERSKIYINHTENRRYALCKLPETY
jgi:hypothetical protein